MPRANPSSAIWITGVTRPLHGRRPEVPDDGRRDREKARLTLEPRLTTKTTNGQDIINSANGINGQFGFLLGNVAANPVLTAATKERLAEFERLWSERRAEVTQLEPRRSSASTNCSGQPESMGLWQRKGAW